MSSRLNYPDCKFRMCYRLDNWEDTSKSGFTFQIIQFIIHITLSDVIDCTIQYTWKKTNTRKTNSKITAKLISTTNNHHHQSALTTTFQPPQKPKTSWKWRKNHHTLYQYKNPNIYWEGYGWNFSVGRRKGGSWEFAMLKMWINLGPFNLK